MVGVLRSLAFYVVFHVGTFACVTAALITMLAGTGGIGRIARGWSAWHRICVRRILGIRIVVEGDLPREGVLVALRHESFFEAIDLPVLLSNPAIFAKAELLRIPMWGKAATGYGLIAVERDQGARALRAMLAAARAFSAQGRLLAIFPEGTRVPHGRPGAIQAGFAGLYKLLGQPVVPVAVNSGPLYHRWWKRKGTITYRVGEVIPAGLLRAEVEARLEHAINALNGEGAA